MKTLVKVYKIFWTITLILKQSESNNKWSKLEFGRKLKSSNLSHQNLRIQCKCKVNYAAFQNMLLSEKWDIVQIIETWLTENIDAWIRHLDLKKEHLEDKEKLF